MKIWNEGERTLTAEYLDAKWDARWAMQKQQAKLNAAVLADRKIVAYLIEHGAKSAVGANQAMPLHAAAERGDLAIVKLLVGRGDDHNVVMNNNVKPVDLARTNQHGEVVQFLERL